MLGSHSGTQPAADGPTFAIDAQTFLSDQSGGLMPGCTPEYRQVTADIHALAADRGLIARLVAADEDMVRDVIRVFNAKGPGHAGRSVGGGSPDQ